MAVKASLSSSNLARPKTLIHQLAARVQDYLHFPDPEPLYAVLGAVAGNMIAGPPVWLMLVGASSSGKTTMLMTLIDLPRVHLISNVSGPGSFISGVGRKDKTKEGDGGLLKRTGDRGLWLFEDFSSSILTMPHEAQKQTVGVLRAVYNGHYDRNPGSDGGKVLVWNGKIGVLGAATAAVDRSQLVNADLGERWTYYRLPEKEDYFGECMTALSNRLPDGKKQELREMIAGFFSAMDLEWGCRVPCTDAALDSAHECREERPWREFKHRESARLTAIASIGARLRSNLIRDNYTRSEIVDVPQKEAPVRLVEELGQLYAGLEVIGLGEDERWKLVSKVGLDSAPQVRVNLFRQVWGVSELGEKLGIKEIAMVLGCGETTIRRHVEDMQAFGVVRKISDAEVVLTDWAVARVKEAGWAK